MSRLTEFAVAKRSVTLLLAGALFVAGLLAWGNLKQELLPDIEFPVITVIAPLPGAGAADVAEQVTKPIERAISGVPRLEALQSTSANSLSLVVAQFAFGTDVKETRAAIEPNLQAAGLPQTVEPTVNALNINASPVIIASISAVEGKELADAAAVAQDEIVPALLGLEGVASVDLTGGEVEQVLITLDPEKLTANNVSLAQVTGVLAANNLTFPSGPGHLGRHEDPGLDDRPDREHRAGRGPRRRRRGPAAVPGAGTPGGPTASGDPAASLDPTASAAPSAAPVAPAAPTPITIGDLGTVELAGVSTTGYARTNGQPALSLSVSKTSNANTVQVAEEVTATLDELKAQHADTVNIDIISDLSTFIIESRDGLLREGGLGALFAVLTIFLFLFSIRATLVAAISIPLSILAALVIMQATGVTLNIMTLGGLAVAVGRVVDDSIVVLENIYRHRALGESRLQASINGPKEVAGAITAATITTVGVFLPLGFVGGLVSQFFLPFALTVTFALLASLICALTVVPVLAYLFINKVRANADEDGEPEGQPVDQGLHAGDHLRRSRAGSRSRGVLAVALVLFVATAALAPLLPTAFINAGSEKILSVTIAPPPGTSSEAVLERTIEAEQILIGIDDVELVQTSIPGEGDAGFQTIVAAQSGRPANSARITVVLDDSVDLTQASKDLSDALAPVKTDGYDVAVSQAAGFTSNNLNVIVSGDDADEVKAANEAVLEALSDNAEPAQPQVRPVHRHARDPGHARSQQGDHGRPHGGPGRPGRPRDARRHHRDPDRASTRTARRPTSSSRSIRRPCRAWRTSASCRSAP